MVSFPIDARAAAFDLDGTLLDTLPDIAAAAVSMLEALGRPPVSEFTVRGFIGNGIPRLTKRLLTGTLDGEPPAELLERARALFEQNYAVTLSRRTRPFPGVEAGLGAFARAGL